MICEKRAKFAPIAYSAKRIKYNCLREYGLKKQLRRLVVKKIHLPEKICLVCEKPFNWRKKWEKDWVSVKYCSTRCKRNKNKSQ